MKNLKIAALALSLTAAAAVPLLAGPPLCGNGLPAALSGDLFAPAECSSATVTAAQLPGEAPKEARSDLKDLEGRWEGNLVHALGRYELLLTVKTGWSGKAELTLDMKELQFRQRLTDRLSLVPSKGRGAYEAVMSTSLLPDASLKGEALLGVAAKPGEKGPPERQMDLRFKNGAAHRVYFSFNGKDELRLRAVSAIPRARLQEFEVALTRTKREAL